MIILVGKQVCHDDDDDVVVVLVVLLSLSLAVPASLFLLVLLVVVAEFVLSLAFSSRPAIADDGDMEEEEVPSNTLSIATA